MPEYLVIFEELERIAQDYGLTLEYKMNFHEFYFSKLNQKNDRARQDAADLFQRMVMNKPQVQELTQDQINQQWDAVGLYCVFVFRKGGAKPFQPQGNFGNNRFFRDIIDVTAWE